MNELLCAKFSVKQSKNKAEIENIDAKDLNGEHHKLSKLIADRYVLNLKSQRLKCLLHFL